MRATVTAKHLRDVLSYDPQTGLFTWRVAPNGRIRVGQVAGSPDTAGHTQIRINKRFYRAHRLAWLHVHGEWPTDFIDHINGDRADNRIANLRVATRSENNRNAKRRVDNTSGLKGVIWHRRAQKWTAKITADKAIYHLGYFESAEAAHAAYVKAAHELHGEFARAA